MLLKVRENACFSAILQLAVPNPFPFFFYWHSDFSVFRTTKRHVMHFLMVSNWTQQMLRLRKHYGITLIIPLLLDSIYTHILFRNFIVLWHVYGDLSSELDNCVASESIRASSTRHVLLHQHLKCFSNEQT
jgi:hypothetical protein